MANEFTLHIDVNNIPSSTSKAKEKLQEVAGKKPQSSGNSSGTGGTDLKTVAKGLGITALGKQIVNTGISYAKYRVNTISARTGDIARQNEINNAISVVESGISTVGAIAGGAIAGATFGPFGAVVGAALGLATDLTNKVITMVENNEQWNLQQDKNKFNEIRNHERLGLMATDRNR